MKNVILKRFLALALAATLAVSSTACANTKNTSDDEADEPEKIVSYQIAVCRSGESPIYDTIVDGFADALHDSAGSASIILNDRIIMPEENGEAVVLGMLSSDNELVFAVGSSALSAAASATTTTPIVGAGVINFQNTLHLLSGRGTWDRLTNRNVTGISAAPYFPDQLSLLIEATPELRTVGILYSPVDTNAIYQNEMLEAYLDEAGIPWKEYEIAETEEALAAETGESFEDAPTVILPATVVAASGKEGPNIVVEAIGNDGNLTGINSPESTRTAKLSKTWTGGKAELIAAEAAAEAEANAQNDSDNAGTDSADPNAANTETADPGVEGAELADPNAGGAALADPGAGDPPSDGTGSIEPAPPEAAPAALSEEFPADLDPENATPEEIVALACHECSALYISAESMLTDQIDMITQIATANGVSTIGGDQILGEKTLACIYSDPYDQGYRAGKVACRILVDGEDASEIHIGQPKEDDLQKLYQDSVANALGMQFPKSFRDIDEFLEAYIPGTYTKRVAKEKE